MSIFEAVHDIKENTDERLDTCARQFAKVLTESYPELTFWQNTPPDSEDLNKEQNDLVSDAMRQPWPDPFESCGHTLGHWLLDVYPGSMKAVQFDNKWDGPYEFNYRSKFQHRASASLSDPSARKPLGHTNCVPPEVADLPQPLMRDFRADKVAIQSICDQVRKSLKPNQGRGQSRYTNYVNEAVRQVALAVITNGDVELNRRKNIELQLERFDGGLLSPEDPIRYINFSDKEEGRIEIMFFLDNEDEETKTEETKTKDLAIDGFIRKVSASLQ